MSESVRDVAKAFLSKAPMSPKKLQKLCFYAQSWYAYFNKKQKLINTEFEAWIHGPVSPELYEFYKDYGFDDIPQTEHFELNEAEQDIVDEVYRVYGTLDGNQLEELTHDETPWKNARKDLSPFTASHNVISIGDMYSQCCNVMSQVQPDV